MLVSFEIKKKQNTCQSKWIASLHMIHSYHILNVCILRFFFLCLQTIIICITDIYIIRRLDWLWKINCNCAVYDIHITFSAT